MNVFKKKYRRLHISKHWLRINSVWRFNKKSRKLICVKNRRPNLVIVGSQKCGTTSLFHYLQKHPQIAPSDPFKEPGYFMFEEWAKKYWSKKNKIKIENKKELLEKYMFKSLTDESYFMDASTYYTQDTNEIKYNVPENIFKESPDCKIIYIIRNPFQRLISVYYHQKRGGDASNLESISNNSYYINTCLYYDRIKSFIDKFGKKQVHILSMEDLVNNGNSELDKIYQFLGLEMPEKTELKIHNKTSSNQQMKFDIETYNYLYPLFLKQQQLLQNQCGIEVNWNLNKEYWVN